MLRQERTIEKAGFSKGSSLSTRRRNHNKELKRNGANQLILVITRHSTSTGCHVDKLNTRLAYTVAYSDISFPDGSGHHLRLRYHSPISSVVLDMLVVQHQCELQNVRLLEPIDWPFSTRSPSLTIVIIRQKPSTSPRASVSRLPRNAVSIMFIISIQFHFQ